MPKIFSKDAKFNVIVYDEQCTNDSWQDMIQACFSYLKKAVKSQ